MNNDKLYFDCDESEGEFIPPYTEKWDTCCDDFVEVLATSLGYEDYIAGFLYIIDQEPFFLEAYDTLALTYLKCDMFSEAEKFCRKGLDIALALIPDNFTGTIPWKCDENRPFLNLHYYYIKCQLNNQNLKKAIQLMEQYITWDKEDRHDIEPLLNDTCLQAGITHLKYRNLGKKE